MPRSILHRKICLALLLYITFAVNSIYLYAAPATDIGDNSNISPTVDLSITPAKKPVDIIILTDYSGTKLAALNTHINALKAQFSAVNVDPVFHIVSSMIRIGVQKDRLHTAVRKAYYNYQINYAKVYTPGTSWNYYYDKWYTIDVTWETTQVLESQIGDLPRRNPQNVTFTRSALQNKYRSNGELWERNYFVRIKCTNDIKTQSEELTVTKEYYSDYSEHYYDYIKSEYATIDSQWSILSYGSSDVSYDVFSIDFDKVNTVPLRSGSDRHMVFLSDGYAKDYSKEPGNYFSFGDMTATLINYIKNNNFQLYGVSPNETRYSTMLTDKITRIEPMGNTALFQAESGKTLMSELCFGNTVHSESEVNPDDIKETADVNGNKYVLLKNSMIKYYSSDDGDIKTLTGIANPVRIFGFQYDPNLYVLDSSGRIYLFSSGKELVAYNNSVPITDIRRGGPYNQWMSNIYLTAAGVPYIETETYNTSTGVTTSHILQRAQIKNGTTLRNLPEFVDVKYFSSNARRNSLQPVVLLYSNGQIHQFENMRIDYSTVGNIETKTPYFIEVTGKTASETNVNSIDSNGNAIFIFKKDGTIRFLNNDWILDSYSTSKKDITYERPVLKNTTENVPLNNICHTYRTDMDRYLFVDNNNNTYMYTGEWKAPKPVLGSNLLNMGNNIRKVVSRVSDNTAGYIYFIYNDGTVGLLTSSYINTTDGFNKWLHYTNLTMLPIGDVKEVYAYSSQEYFLKDNGEVIIKHPGSTYTEPANFVKYFKNSITLNHAKEYLSLLNIFNQSDNAAFYAIGAYTAAFADIYNKYSYSSSGSMYVVLGDEIKYESTYDDYEKDPEYSRKWVITHDPYCFDNSMGLSAYHNPAGFAVNPPARLDKTGRYTINLYARDNPKSNNLFDNYRLWSLGDHNLAVYVHRRPIAKLKTAITNNGNGTYTVAAADAGSYDLDHYNSRVDKGIVAREWRWRESASTQWTNTQMNKGDCDPEKSYIIQLRVKDAEGVWSDYAAVNIDRNNPPVALFSLDKNLIKDTDVLKVRDQSFCRSFSTITNWHWVVKKLNADGSVPAANLQNAQFTNSNAGTGSLTGYDANVKTGYAANGAGTYRVYLRVKDSNGLWSDGGTDSTTPADLSKYYSMDFVADRAPTTSFTVANSVIRTTDLLRVKDTTTTTGISPVTKWHWIVRKLNADGSVPSTDLQSEIFLNSNAGIGAMAGYDVNVKTDYSTNGTGNYRIYLRACNGNGMWSDGGMDSAFNLSSFFYRDIVVDTPPTAGFVIEKNPIEPSELLRLRDTSVKNGVSEIDRWHWVVRRHDGAGGTPGTVLLDAQFDDCNRGTGALTGYDSNVMTYYSEYGPGSYSIYLRVRNAGGMWSEGGTDSNYNLDGFFRRELIVKESFKISNFRVVKVKDLHLEEFYYNSSRGQYEDRPMDVNVMAIDRDNFNGMIEGLTKGYSFEFELDTVNFNDSSDTIKITPHFYTCDSHGRDTQERGLYWENSRHEILKSGEGAHQAWAVISLGSNERTIVDESRAIWRGSYLIPGTAWAVPMGTTAANAVSRKLNKDIIVSFEIKGYKDGVMKFDYNLSQWPGERVNKKQPYDLGDVIRYDYTRCNLDDNKVIINRP